MQLLATRKFLDRFAITASALCMIHCLATPLLVVLVPTLASTVLVDEMFHRLLVLWIAPASVVALGMGCRHHKDRSVLTMGAAGLVGMTATAFLGHDLFGGLGEKVVTVLASVVIAIAHWSNYRLCRKHECATA